MKSNKNAFTLGEVLITLSIIGVVAAITMPSLLNSWQNKAYATSISKFYNLYNTSIENMFKDDMAMTLPESRTAKLAPTDPNSFWQKYFKVMTKCDQNYDECFSTQGYSTANGKVLAKKVSTYLNNDTSKYAFVLVNGTVIASGPIAENNTILIDTNGKKGPNKLGKDFFIMKIDKNGDIGADTDNAKDCTGKSDITDFDSGCFTKIRQDGWVIK